MQDTRRGSALIEFTLTGMCIMFIGMSICECAFAMYEYVSMDNAVTIAGRYAASHGVGCTQNGNACQLTMANVATVLANYTTIMSTSSVTVNFTDNNGTTSCTLNTCATYTSTYFPSTSGGANAVGNPITISVTHKIRNPIVMFWPPANMDDTGYTVGANSTQLILF
ncbi:MAG: pilus assembly protein [Acidobacteriota bacterium]|nr:pilus assembly protein [Acidobacteriota bacterium]